MGATPSPTTKPTTGKSTGSTTDAVAAKILSLLESLHTKIDQIPKCECTALRQEILDVKATIASLLPSPPPPSESTYAVVKKAINDATLYADKAKRAVWVGRKEGADPDDTTAADQRDLEQVFRELNDTGISQAFKDKKITFHRHPEPKEGRTKRILKIEFPNEKLRNQFLSLSRSIRPPTICKQNGNFVRRDLCPFELEMERKARIDAFVLNCKLGALGYGIRDEKLIKFGGNPRPLPPGYESRPPRGFASTSDGNPSSLNTSIFMQSNLDSLANESNATTTTDVLSSLTPIVQSKATASAAGKPHGAGRKA